MPFYRGSTADGSDMEEVSGMHVSPDGKEWSSEPYPLTKEQRYWEEIYSYLAKNNRGIVEEYELILKKQSKLNKRYRDFIEKLVNNDKNDVKTLEK
jgi:hypothetical protein